MSPTPCNGAIIENAKGEILLVERKEDPAKGKWDVPGGFIETGESYEESLKREVREELNIEIEVGETVFIANDTYHFQEVDIPTLAIFSKAKIISGEIAPADDAVAYKFFPKEEILNQDIAFRGIKEALQKFLH